MGRKPGHESLDNLDWLMVRELETDARQSYRDLAKKLGMTPTTARRRLQKLLDQRVITIAVMANPIPLGYALYAYIGITTCAGKIDAVAEKLVPFTNVQSVLITTGHYDIIAVAAFQSAEELLDFISEGLGSISEILNAETIFAFTKAIKTPWTYLQDGASVSDMRERKSPARNLNELDLLLIKELQSNPRQTIMALAKKLGISRARVGNKLQRLQEEGVITVVGVRDWSTFGYDIRAVLILIKAHPSTIYSVANELKRHSKIQHVFITMGRYDIVAWVLFKDSEEMHKFIGGELDTVSGVIHREIVLIVKVEKFSFMLPLVGTR